MKAEILQRVVVENNDGGKTAVSRLSNGAAADASDEESDESSEEEVSTHTQRLT